MLFLLQTFFSQSSSYKPRLENIKSMNKTITESVKGMPNLDISDLQIKISNIDAHFKVFISA